MTKKKIDVVREALNAIRAEIHKHAKDFSPGDYQYLMEELISDCEGAIEGLNSEEDGE